MRQLVGLTVLVLSVVGCGSSESSDTNQENVTDQSLPGTETSSTTESSVPGTGESLATLDDLAKVACSDTPMEDTGDYGMLTDGTWFCTYNGEDVRIDMFTDEEQLTEAADTLLSFYSSGNGVTLAAVPIVCGKFWAVGVDTNETRNALIAAFIEDGVTASTCD